MVADPRRSRGAVAAFGAAWLYVVASCADTQDPRTGPPTFGEQSVDDGGIFEDASLPINGTSLVCMGAAGCLPGQVCCGAAPMNSGCQVGPCQAIGGVGVIQLCEITAECPPGDTCGPPAKPLPVSGLMITICNPPEDGGSDAEAGLDADASGAEASLAPDAPDEASEDAAPGDAGSGTEGGDR